MWFVWKNFPPKKSSSKKNARDWKRDCRNLPTTCKPRKLNAQTQRGTVEERQNRLREIQEQLEPGRA